jgi:hypothetical protein
LVEHSLGKGEVTSSILVIGSRDRDSGIEIAMMMKGVVLG